MITYETIKGYSVPVVRMFMDGKPFRTLSFTKDGFPINPPDDVTVEEFIDAFNVWKKAG